MWIDESQCTKPCSVVISRISTPCEPRVLEPKSEPTEEGQSAVVKQRKFFRTSSERSLLIKSGLTGQERKSSRLHGPKSRLRSRTVLNYSKNMPAPVRKDCTPTYSDDRQKASLSNMYYKTGEWQKSSSLNSFKLRLKCLNKEKHLQTKRKWTLQNRQTEESSKPSKEDTTAKSSAVTETDYELVKVKNENVKKTNHQATVVSRNFSSTLKHTTNKVIKSDKKPLSKLVILCNKAYRHHQAMLGKPVGSKTKAEAKQEETKMPKKMTAYTVYTKLRENSIESINCKRYKKRKEVKSKVESCFRTVRDTSSLNSVTEFNNFRSDGSVESDVRVILDTLLKDVVSSELDELLSLETPTPEIKELLRVFCKQYGYNYDKDFADIQNSVLNFRVTDSSMPIAKKTKARSDINELEQKQGDIDLKTTFKKGLKRRRKRKRDSSDDSNEEECPEILSAVMRSRSKDRRNRLSLQSNKIVSELLMSDSPKHHKLFFPTDQACPNMDDSEMDNDVPMLNSPSEEVTKFDSDENEETDCGDINDHNVSGHMYIPPLSSEDSSEDEELRTTNQDSPTKTFEERSNPIECSDKQPCDELLSNTVVSKSPTLQESVTSPIPSTSCESASKDKESLDLPQGEPVAASMPSIDRLFGNVTGKSEDYGVEKDQSAVEVVSSEDTTVETEEKNKRAETPVRSLSVGSPDTDWESDKLVICLDADENSSGESASNERRGSPEPMRGILYHTPKLPIDSRVSDFFRAATTTSTPLVASFAPTFVQNSESSATDATYVNPRTGVVSPQRAETTGKEAQGNHLLSKHHRTPVQKVFPQVKSLNLPQLNSCGPHQNQPRQKGLATVHPKTQHSISAISPEAVIPHRNKDLPHLASTDEYPENQPVPARAVSSSTPPLITTPVLNQTAPTVCVPPLPTQIPSPVPIPALPSIRVPSLAVVPVVSPPAPIHANSTKTLHAVTIPLTPASSPVLTGSLPIVSDQVPLAASTPVAATDIGPRNRNVDTVSVPQVQSSIPQLNSQNALDISILRSLLLDPPPEDIASNEIHSLILQKAKELEDKEEAQDSEFNMPVISNVVSLKEEALKKGTEDVGFHTTQEASPTPKTPGGDLEHFPERVSDSPEIVEEKLKSSTNFSKQLPASRTNTPHGETFNDVLRNLQLEIKNLEKMAEEKKKEYFLIMYVRNFKRDTLRRLHESLQAKNRVSHTSKMTSQCAPGTEPSHTHLKETCLVRPMVQIQPQSTPLPQSQSNKSPEPQKDIRIMNSISDSQGKPRSFSPDHRRPPAGNTASLNSSLAALAKVESDYRTGFRSYLSHAGNVKDSAVSTKISDVNVNNSRSSFSKYQPQMPHVKDTLQIPEAHQKSTSTVTQSPIASTGTPPQISSSVNYNPGLSTWKGTVSAYLQKSKAYAGKSDFPPVHAGPPPPYANTVKNLLKQSSTTVTNSGISPVSSLAKDYSKGAENMNSTRARVSHGPTQLSQPPFLDFYPFHGPGAPNAYLQANPFWPASSYGPKHNSSLASLQAARELYMNSLTLGAWRTTRNSEVENEKLGDKTSCEKMWNPVSASAPSRVVEPQKEVSQNLVTNRPYHYGLLRKCVVCKVADAQFICSGCGKDWYCSVNCQRQNWKIHSRSCVSSTT